MARTLKLCLIEQTIAPQLDVLLHALAGLTPPGDDLVVPDEVLAETRRVFADLRRVLGATPLQVTEPGATPVTRATLRFVLREALSTFVMFAEVNRRTAVRQAQEARKTGPLEKSAAKLSPRPLGPIE